MGTNVEPGVLPGIVLAAGLSRRMGSCKLLLPWRGAPLLSHVLKAAQAPPPDEVRAEETWGGLSPLMLVIGPHTPDLSKALEAPSLHLVLAPNAVEGQAESLKAGLRALLEIWPECPGVMVLLGDQPLVTTLLVRNLARCFLDHVKQGYCVAPSFAGQRGNPVVLHRDLFPAVLRLEGDSGARTLLAQYPIHLLSCPDNACLVDVDTPEEYHTLISDH